MTTNPMKAIQFGTAPWQEEALPDSITRTLPDLPEDDHGLPPIPLICTLIAEPAYQPIRDDLTGRVSTPHLEGLAASPVHNWRVGEALCPSGRRSLIGHTCPDGLALTMRGPGYSARWDGQWPPDTAWEAEAAYTLLVRRYELEPVVAAIRQDAANVALGRRMQRDELVGSSPHLATISEYLEILPEPALLRVERAEPETWITETAASAYGPDKPVRRCLIGHAEGYTPPAERVIGIHHPWTFDHDAWADGLGLRQPAWEAFDALWAEVGRERAVTACRTLARLERLSR
jgi:hypothetical protein